MRDGRLLLVASRPSFLIPHSALHLCRQYPLNPGDTKFGTYVMKNGA